MSEQCAVSVLVPICNVERYLRECLESLMAQTLEDLQIICIDDGSTDSSLSIAREFEALDPRFEIITKPNSGYGNSMNIGLDKSRGRYIGIVESDDFAECDMFEKLFSLADKHDADVVKSNFFAHTTYEDPSKDAHVNNLEGCTLYKVHSPKDNYASFLGRPAIWSGLYKASFLKTNGIRFLESPGASFQDTSFNFKIFAAAERAYLVKEAYLHYRIDNSNSSVKSLNKVFCICDEYQEIWRFAHEHGLMGTDLAKLIPQIQFGGYKWNLDRLTPSLQPGFYKKFISEFEALSASGLIERSHFNPAAWQDLANMLADPDKYYASHYGPKEVETTFLLYFEQPDEQLIRSSVSELSHIASDKDEIIIVSGGDQNSANRITESMREVDKRIFTPIEIFENPYVQSVSTNLLRGAFLVCINASSPEFEPCSLKRALRESPLNTSFKALSSCIYAYRTENLREIQAPAIAAFLSSSLYIKSEAAPLNFPKASGAFPDAPDASIYRSAKETINAFLRYADKAIPRTSYESRIELIKALSPLWLSAKKSYYALDFEGRVDVGNPLSSQGEFTAIMHNKIDPAESPDISIIVPIYNAEKYLEECVDSILAQCNINSEIIFINDGSPDASLKLVERIVNEHPRTLVVTQLNSGAGSARNRGIDLAKGRYIAFIDPDDHYPDPETLSSLLRAADQHGTLMTGGSLSVFRSTSEAAESPVGHDSFYTVRNEGYVTIKDLQNDYGWIRFIYRRSLFEKSGLRMPEYLWYEDPVFFLKAIDWAGKVYMIDKVVYEYRVEHKSNKWNPAKVIDLLKGIQINLKYASAKKLTRLYSTLVNRIEHDYYKPIMDNLDDREVFARLIEIQSSLDVSLINHARERGMNGYLIRELDDLRTQSFEHTAIVRLAHKTEKTKFYKVLQRIRELFPE